MARIDYVDPSQPGVRPLIEQILAKRGTVTALHRILLHSPPLALAWLQFIYAIREQCILPGDLRELIILRVAALNGSAYHVEQHTERAIKEGLTLEQCSGLGAWQDSDLFDERQQAVLAYVDFVTLDIQVPDGVFAAIRNRFTEQEIVELTVTIGAYNLLSRLLEALQVRASDIAGPVSH